MEHAQGIRWVQLNQTIVPVLRRIFPNKTCSLVPLDILRYAAGLLLDVSVEYVTCTKNEADRLMKCCDDRGFMVTFDENTELVDLDLVPKYSKQKVVLSLLSSANLKDLLKWKHDMESFGKGYDCESQQKKDGLKPVSESGYEDGKVEHTFENHKLNSDGIKDTQLKLSDKNPQDKIFGQWMPHIIFDGKICITLQRLHSTFFKHVNYSKFITMVNYFYNDMLLSQTLSNNKENRDVYNLQVVEVDIVEPLLVKMKDRLEKDLNDRDHRQSKHPVAKCVHNYDDHFNSSNAKQENLKKSLNQNAPIYTGNTPKFVLEHDESDGSNDEINPINATISDNMVITSSKKRKLMDTVTMLIKKWKP